MIVDPPLLTIRRTFQRASSAILAPFRGVATGAIADAMGGRGAVDHALKPIDPQCCQFVGSALTCETGPSDNLAILAALTMAQEGDVIVAASDGFKGSAVVGDNVALMARARGVKALVIDGMARDACGLIQARLPVFARGLTPNSCVRSGPGRVGLPTIVGGVAVDSGDVIVGDRDGVVVVPCGSFGVVLAKLAEVLQAEVALQAQIKAGLTQLGSVAALFSTDKVRFVDEPASD
jgi:4-hydroxy-4-methyl-2-oxoglutarate aldolase